MAIWHHSVHAIWRYGLNARWPCRSGWVYSSILEFRIARSMSRVMLCSKFAMATGSLFDGRLRPIFALCLRISSRECMSRVAVALSRWLKVRGVPRRLPTSLTSCSRMASSLSVRRNRLTRESFSTSLATPGEPFGAWAFRPVSMFTTFGSTGVGGGCPVCSSETSALVFARVVEPVSPSTSALIGPRADRTSASSTGLKAFSFGDIRLAIRHRLLFGQHLNWCRFDGRLGCRKRNPTDSLLNLPDERTVLLGNLVGGLRLEEGLAELLGLGHNR